MSAPLPPYDVPAERATLGAILLDRDAITAVADWLAPDAFYLEKHARVYAAALACYGRREPPDVTTVAAELRVRGDIDMVGGLSGLMDFVDGAAYAVHVEHYGRIVADAATRRRLIEAGGHVAAAGYDTERPLDAALDAAESALFRVTQGRRAGQPDGVDMPAAMADWWAHIARLQSGDVSPGLSTGWADLDDALLIEPAMLHILAARPGVGKSALALALARNIASRGERVLYFSLEMKRTALLNRLAAMESGVDADRLRRGLLSEFELRALSDAAGRMVHWPIHICDRFDLSGLGLRGYARRQHAAEPVGLIIVDHLGLLVPPKAENRNVAVGELSRGLVQLAGELGPPILALSQLNREVERRSSHVPILADLRDSGSVEQDAATVSFLHRPSMYDKDASPSLLEWHIAKNRNGELRMVPLHFQPRTMRAVPQERWRAAEGYSYEQAAD